MHDDLISRTEAIKAIDAWDQQDLYLPIHFKQVLEELPSAQQEFEWCHDCKEYDQERHCCPRWTKVIRRTVEELKQPQWIPCDERLPKESGEYLVTIALNMEVFVTESEYFAEIHDEYPWRDYGVIAWMPLPEPYEVEE